jgi:hypothetical protein
MTPDPFGMSIKAGIVPWDVMPGPMIARPGVNVFLSGVKSIRYSF